MLWEKETYKYLGILEADTNKQAEMKEKRVISVKRENYKKTTIEQKFHQRDKHQGCPHCKILVTNLKVDEGRTSTNGSENEKN